MAHLLLGVIYLSFISLGLPDSLLGAAWPSMYGEFGVPVSYAGILSMIISAGTIVSSLQSDRLTRRLGAGRVTAISVGMTAAALFGFSVTHSFWLLCLWAVPYGLGAGSVDAALNNYVALHYASRHMSWLHCMWGLGASLGPYIMGYALAGGSAWNMGYRSIALLQILLTAGLFVSLPLWRGAEGSGDAEAENRPLSLGEIVRIPKARAVMVTFFGYCALEQTAMLWASSYLVLHKGIAPETAAFYASLFCVGITAGRALSGFLTWKLTDSQMVRLGCAPIYPSVIHATPAHFGADRSQAMIGVEMASAYVGTCLMPPLFGLIAAHIHVALFPVYLLALLVIMAAAHEKLLAGNGREKPNG